VRRAAGAHAACQALGKLAGTDTVKHGSLPCCNDAPARVDDASNLDVPTQVGKEGKEEISRPTRKRPYRPIHILT